MAAMKAMKASEAVHQGEMVHPPYHESRLRGAALDPADRVVGARPQTSGIKQLFEHNGDKEKGHTGMCNHI
jgi:hypothetical protein